MIGLLMNFTRVPLMCFGAVAAITILCGFLKCCSCRCRLRDCACVKRCLRVTGYDKFDDFELTVLVHEALFERRQTKLTTVVRITCGRFKVTTDPSSKGTFQQYLQIVVEQGTQNMVVDLLDSGDRILATLKLNVMDSILQKKNSCEEEFYAMKQKGKGVRNPKVKLTLVTQQAGDIESGLLANPLLEQFAHRDVGADIQLRQQIAKAEAEARQEAGSDQVSSMEVLKQACSGPLDRFEGLGGTVPVYVAVLGPPKVRRWTFGIWGSKQEYEQKIRPSLEIDMMKITSVQADPSRAMVFRLSYQTTLKLSQTVTFRRTDRARDVWVEMLQILITKAHEAHKESKEDRVTSRTTSRTTKTGRATQRYDAPDSPKAPRSKSMFSVFRKGK